MAGRTKMVAIAASFLIVAGIAKAVAGVFLVDPCCTPALQSAEQEIHDIAGGVHYFTLGMAALMWSVAARHIFGRRSGWFRWYSLISVVLAIASITRNGSRCRGRIARERQLAGTPLRVRTDR
jgi:hypothetical protein